MPAADKLGKYRAEEELKLRLYFDAGYVNPLGMTSHTMSRGYSE